jgi:hypothetical protein
VAEARRIATEVTLKTSGAKTKGAPDDPATASAYAPRCVVARGGGARGRGTPILTPPSDFRPRIPTSDFGVGHRTVGVGYRFGIAARVRSNSGCPLTEQSRSSPRSPVKVQMPREPVRAASPPSTAYDPASSPPLAQARALRVDESW